MQPDSPYRKPMSPEEFAMKQMLMEAQQQNSMQNYLARLQQKQGQDDEKIAQRFQDVQANPRARFSSGLVSDDTYGPTLSTFIGGQSIQPAIAQINNQFDQRDAAIANMRGLYNNISRLAPDEEMVAKELEPYQQKMQMYAKDRDRHAYQKIALDAQEFAQKLNSNRTALGAASINYRARAQQDEFLRKQLQDGKITAEDYNLAMSIADQDYQKQGGIGKGQNNIYSTYKPVMPAYIDQIELMNKAIQGWNSNQGAWANAGLNINGEIIGTKKVGGVEGFVIKNKTSGKEEFIRTDEVMSKLAPVLQNDAKLQDYFQWQARVADFKTNDNQIVESAKNVINSAEARIAENQKLLATFKNNGNFDPNDKSKVAQRARELQMEIEYLQEKANTYNQVLEQGDIDGLRQIRKQALMQKFNKDLVNLGTAKTDFSKVDVVEDISADQDWLYAKGLEDKKALGENTYKQDGQLVAKPRFTDVAGYNQLNSTYTTQLADTRKEVAKLFTTFGAKNILQQSPNDVIKLLYNLKSGKSNFDPTTNSTRIQRNDGSYYIVTPSGQEIDGSKIDQLYRQMESVASKKHYADYRMQTAEKLAMQEINSNPELKAEYDRYLKSNNQINVAGAKYRLGTGSMGQMFKGATFNSLPNPIQVVYKKYLDQTRPLESVSSSYLDIQGKNGKIDYSIAEADKKAIAESLGAKLNVGADDNGDVVLKIDKALDVHGLKVQMEGNDVNNENPTDFKTALTTLNADDSKPIKIGTNQVRYERVLGDVKLVIPVTYYSTENDDYVTRAMYVSTDRNDGIWTRNIENLKNSPEMRVKRNLTQAISNAVVGDNKTSKVPDRPETAIPVFEYGDRVKLSQDGKTMYIKAAYGGYTKYETEAGVQKLIELETSMQKD